MRIQVRSLDIDPATFMHKILAGELDLPQDLFSPDMPLSLTIKAIKAGDEVILNVVVDGHYQCVCSRCLEPFEQDRTVKFDLYFDIDRHTDFIDCDDDLRQEMIIAFVSNPLCSPECKGLCKECGANLNFETCRCNSE